VTTTALHWQEFPPFARPDASDLSEPSGWTAVSVAAGSARAWPTVPDQVADRQRLRVAAHPRAAVGEVDDVAGHGDGGARFAPFATRDLA
jgi:hypothetical protein